MTDPTDRIAKALYARRARLTAAEADILWPALDESERTQYRLDAVAAMGAMQAGDRLRSGLRVVPEEPSERMQADGWVECAPYGGLVNPSDVYRAMLTASSD